VCCVAGTGSWLGVVSSANHSAALMTAGLVQEYDHVVLASVRPPHALLLTVTAMAVCSLITCVVNYGLPWSAFDREHIVAYSLQSCVIKRKD